MRKLFWIILLFSSLAGYGQTAGNKEQYWVDSVYAALTPEQRIGQLMMIRAHSGKGEKYEQAVAENIRKYAVGGLCFFQGTPERQVYLVNRYQKLSKVPLLVSQDAEYGLAMRLQNTFKFPYQMTMGAMEDDSLVYCAGRQIAKQLKMTGVRMNFAPVVDVNNNPQNPIINSRSFGEDKKLVAAYGLAYMRGLQDEGVIAVAKHFPGHGDTDMDSHKTLPQIKVDRKRLDSIELFPFKTLIDSGVGGVMIAHLSVPALEDEKGVPTTLSKKVVTDLLEKDLGFHGLKITDALEMKGVSLHYPAGEAALKALQAGNDILLLPEDLKMAVRAIQQALEKGEIRPQWLEEKVKKQLHFKYQYVLSQYDSLRSDSLMQRLNSPENLALSKKIFEKAVTVLTNHDSLLPLRRPDTMKIASLSIGNAQKTVFQKILEKYAAIDAYSREKNIFDKEKLLKQLADYDLVIVGLHHTSIFPHRNFGLRQEDLAFIDSLRSRTGVVLSLFGSPYALNKLKNAKDYPALILGYEDKDEAQSVVAQIIMGALPSQGHLPVSTREFPLHSGMRLHDIGRLQYASPAELGFSGGVKKKIDSIVYANIKEHTFPGCQILMAKDGKVFLEQAYGYHTYQKSDEVRLSDIYDLASLTKIFASTVSVMRLNQEGRLDIDRPLSDYLPYLKQSNKKDMFLREIMAHQAGLKPWIPFYTDVLDKKGFPSKKFFVHRMKEGYSTPVADGLYVKDDYSYTIYRKIAKSRLRRRRDYKYSDLGFYLIKKAVENITMLPFEDYVSRTFYKPLGMQHTFYKPLEHYPLKRIVPTEKDTYFRHGLVHGYVHDPGAALLGGVSGHAGLFSNVNDLAIMAQMFLQNGYYGGVQYVDTVQLKEFTKEQFPLNSNRRGIGFDRPEPKRDEGPSCDGTSDKSFGHSGFTGTYFWVDPQYNLLYVFLSNRVYPTADNHKIVKYNVRTDIMQVVYDALKQREK